MAFVRAAQRPAEFEARNSWSDSRGPKPAFLKNFGDMCIDQRWVRHDQDGSKVKLGDDPHHDVVHVATSLPGLESACKLERCMAMFIRASDDWSESLRRAALLESLLTTNMSLNQFQGLCLRIHQACCEFGIQVESVQSYLDRIELTQRGLGAHQAPVVALPQAHRPRNPMQVLESLGFDQHGNLRPQQPVQHNNNLLVSTQMAPTTATWLVFVSVKLMMPVLHSFHHHRCIVRMVL